jgi:hypothetical protein
VDRELDSDDYMTYSGREMIPDSVRDDAVVVPGLDMIMMIE